jgi:hypothetical protein
MEDLSASSRDNYSTLDSFQAYLQSNLTSEQEERRNVLNIGDIAEFKQMLAVMVEESSDISEDRLEEYLALHDHISNVMQITDSDLPEIKQEPLELASPCCIKSLPEHQPPSPFNCPICYEEDIPSELGYILRCQSLYCRQVRPNRELRWLFSLSF